MPQQTASTTRRRARKHQCCRRSFTPGQHHGHHGHHGHQGHHGHHGQCIGGDGHDHSLGYKVEMVIVPPVKMLIFEVVIVDMAMIKMCMCVHDVESNNSSTDR